MLKQAGIVVLQRWETEAQQVNEAFLNTDARQPFGILKVWRSMGRLHPTGGHAGSFRVPRIGSVVAACANAIVTGNGTFLKDRPEMTDRPDFHRRELLRIVLDRRGSPPYRQRVGWVRRIARELMQKLGQGDAEFPVGMRSDTAFNAIQARIIVR
jgi:hypothetical protein